MTHGPDPSGMRDMGDLDPSRFTLETRAQWDEYVARCRAFKMQISSVLLGQFVTNAAGDKIYVKSVSRTSVTFHCARQWTKERRRAEFMAQQLEMKTGRAHPTLARTYEYEVRWDG